jgi:hypothetical protein
MYFSGEQDLKNSLYIQINYIFRDNAEFMTRRIIKGKRYKDAGFRKPMENQPIF